MLLWILLAVMTAGVLVYLLWPLARQGEAQGSMDPQSAGQPEPETAFDAEIYRDQLKEISLDEERGLISPEDAEAARVEISRRLLAIAAPSDSEKNAPENIPEDSTDKDSGNVSHQNVSHQAKQTDARLGPAFYAAAAMIPALSLAIYLALGHPGLPGQPFAERAQQPIDRNNVQALVAKVEDILRKNPTDGRGWAVLAPVYLRQQRYPEAVDAYRKALSLKGPSANLWAGYGEALRLANEGVISEEARQAYLEALKLDKTLVVPKIALAMAKAQDGRPKEAVSDLRKLLAEGGKEAPWKPVVEEQIAAFEALAARRMAAMRPPGSAAPGPSAPGPGPTAQDIEDARSMTPQERMAMINSMVEGLAERLKQNKTDLAGWLRLINSYVVLRRHEDAAKALKTAREAFAQDKAALAKLDALAKNLGLGA